MSSLTYLDAPGSSAQSTLTYLDDAPPPSGAAAIARDLGVKLNIGSTVDIPEQVGGVNDLLRKSTPLGQATEAILPDRLKVLRRGVETAIRGALDQRRKTLESGLSPEQQAADKKPYFTDDASWENLSSDGVTGVPGKVAELINEGKLFGEGWGDWRKVTGSAVQSAPGTLVTMVPVAGAAGTTSKAAYARVLAATGDEALAAKAATTAAERTAMFAGGAAEGMQGAGAANEQTRRTVLEMPIEKLRESPFFQRALAENGGDETAARQVAADAAATSSAAGAFLFDATLGGLGDRYLGTAAAGKGTRAGAVARGTVQEAPTEFVQSGGEKFSENLALQRFADPSQKLMQDVGEEAVAGGLSGGLMGGVMGGAMHRNAGPARQDVPQGGQAADATEVLGAPEVPPTAAEQALFAPRELNALDRAMEVERLQAEAAQSWASAPDAERPALRERLDDLTAERERLTAGWPALTRGAQTSFSTESGARLDAQYALAEADDLVTSHDENLRPVEAYPAELQPRERERHASEIQVSGIVQRLDPARLGLSADAATGAPIVGADGLVESGNARTIALKRVYQANGQKAEDYRAFLTENAERFGIDAGQIAAMRRPVLVRVRATPVDRAEFARQANAAPVAQMSPSELARQDAARIEVMDDLKPTDDGDFANSHGFIRRFMARLPATEQAALIDSGGRLSQAGYARIRNAILAKAYGDSPVLVRLIESVDDNLRNVGKAMMQAAPEVAKLRQDVAEGVLHDADIVPDLMAAVTELSALKDSGRSVADALAQAGMFGERYSPETRELLQFLHDNLRRPRRMAEFIVRYSEALRAAGNPNQGSIFGDTAAPTKGQLLTAAKRETDADQNSERTDAGKDASPGGQSAGQSADAQRSEGRAQSHETSDQPLVDQLNTLNPQLKTKLTVTWVDASDPRVAQLEKTEGGTAVGGHNGSSIILVRGRANRQTLLHEIRHMIDMLLGGYELRKWLKSDADLMNRVVAYLKGERAAGRLDSGSRMTDVEETTQSLLDAYYRNKEGLRSEFPDIVQFLDEMGADKYASIMQQVGAGETAQQSEWVAFPPETGTLGIPRADMPQIKGDHRGALIQFLEGQGIAHETLEGLPAKDLRPTQAEFSTKKTATWKDVREGVDRSVLISADRYILDGHHQWVAALATGGDVKAIRFNAPIAKLLATTHQFPSARRGEGAGTDVLRSAAREDFQAALADLGVILRDFAGVARMVPEQTPDLMPTLVKLFEAAIRAVGYNVKDLIAYVKKALRADPRFKTVWNKINEDTYRKAARQAVDSAFEKPQAAGQGDLFAAPVNSSPAQGETLDLFAALRPVEQKKAPSAMIAGRPYDMGRDNYKPKLPPEFLTAEQLKQADAYVAQYYKPPGEGQSDLDPEVRASAEAALKPLLKLAEEAKVEYDQKIINIARKQGAVGQMLAPLKSLKRAAEKVALDYSGDASQIKDLLRSTIVVESYADAPKLLEAIRAEFDVLSVKDKTTPEARERNGGYADYTVFVTMPNGVKAEIQINTPPMLSIKAYLGHKLYEAARVMRALQGPDADSIYAAMGEIYAAAFAFGVKAEGGVSRNVMPPRGAPSSPDAMFGQAINSDSSSENRNQLPSGNMTNSSPEKVGTNTQPAGNLSGTETFISSTSSDSVAENDGSTYTESEKKASASVAELAEPRKVATDKIADFGEKIGGARKDVWTSFKDAIREVTDSEIATQPLSKIWPEPNYQALIDSGADPWSVSFMHACRDEIPPKPRSSWKVKRWASQVQLLREMSVKLIDGVYDKGVVQGMMRSGQLSKLASRVELYELVGHAKSLAGISFAHHHYSLYKGRENVSLWVVEKDSKATAFGNWPSEIATADTKEALLDQFKSRYAALNTEKQKRSEVSFDLYSQNKQIYVGKKAGRNIIELAGPFVSVKDARGYRDTHQAELVDKLEKAKEIPRERRDINNPRVGEDMRNGQDVTPELFASAFGFRGVEFGNWVEQSKRQNDLNDAYDALMDMAAIIGVPPRAISLNGELGLAFGARGTGGVHSASAHYEPGKIVINLTKKSGAGSLGHEWWHALDNYFSRLRKQGGYMTTALDVSLASRDAQYMNSTAVRSEMIDAFGRVVKAIRSTAIKARSSRLDAKRSKDYWTTGEEMAARAFESYLISKLHDQNASNDYLANIVDPETWKAAESLGFELDNSYPYPTAGEMPVIREAFDHLFETIQNKETESGVALFSRNRADVAALDTANRRMARFVDEFVAGRLRDSDTQLLGDTPVVLRALGADELPFQIDGATVRKVLAGKHKNDVSPEVLSNIAEHLYNPLAVFSSASEGGFVFLTESVSNNGKPIVAAIHVNKRHGRMLVNDVASVHEKSNPERSFESWMQQGLLRYIRNEKDLSGSAIRHLFPASIGEGKGLASNVLTETDVVNAFGPRYARGDGGGMSVRDLRAVRDRVAEQMSNLPPVNVLESPAQAPAELRDYIEAAGAWDDVEGAYHEGEIYLFASGLTSEERAEFVLATHEITHYGLRGAFGVSVDPILQQIWMHNASVRKAATELRARNGLKSNVAAVEEVLADMPNEALVKLKGWRRLVQFVRDWLAKNGFKRLAKQMSAWMTAGMDEQAKADVFVADVLRTARAWVTEGKRQTGKHVGGTRLAGVRDGWLFSRATAEAAEVETTENRADAIIADTVGAIRPLDAIAKALVKGARIDRLTTALYDKAAGLLDRYVPEQIKAGVVADYGVPEAVIDRRTTMHGAMKRQVRDAGKLIDKLATLTRAESRVAYEWMNNADPQAAEYFEKQLPPESVKVMAEVKQLIDRLSQEAVKLGQLDPDAFARNRFEYLRRSYVKHTAELTRGEGETRQRAISILGDQYKGRGMSDAVPMAKFRNVAPEWWGRKLKNGQADKALRGEKFIRLERRAPTGEGSLPLEQAQGPGDTNPQKKGKLLEVAYWPASEPMPTKYSTWEQSGTWEVRDTKGGDLIVWRDFTKQERIGMGEIDEARFAIAKTLHGMIHDVETGRYLEWLGRRYGQSDASKVSGTIVEATDKLRQTYGKDDWVQVPESKITGTAVKKYGALAGKYLPGPIWNDVRQTVGFRFAPLGETYAAILNAWKTSKTALSPAVHLNNVMANFVMADWHDVSAGHVLKALRLILSAHERDGKGVIGRTGNGVARLGREDRETAREVLNRFADSGGNIGSWATAELQQEQLAPLLDALDKEVATAGKAGEVGVMVALQKAMQLRFPSAWEAFKPTVAGKALTTEARNMISLYESEDQVFRLAAWLRAKEEGLGDLEAGKAARRSFLDYNINAPWVQAMRKTAFPFIAFTYRAVPMLLEVAAKKPWKLLKLGALAAGLNALGYLLSGGDEEDERRYLPEEKAGRVLGVVPKLIRMPWNDPNGSPVFLDIRRFVPVGDFFDTGATHAAVPLLPFAVPSGPLAVMAELVANRSQFTGKDIAMETDTPSEQAGKVIDHLYKAFAPNLAILPGTYAFDGIVQANSGRTDAFGREQSTAQAVGSAFGVKLGSYPSDVLRMNAWRETQAKTMEIDRTINQLKRERMRNGITADEFQDKLAAQMDKKRAIVEKFRQK